MPMRQKGLSIFRPATALGILLPTILVVCVFSCSKKDTEESPKSAPPAPSVVETPEGTVRTAVDTAAAKKQEGGQTHKEYIAELGSSAKENQSFARREAMAVEILHAREKFLAEENEDIQARLTEIETRKAALAAAQQALADAEKALHDAYAADPEWVAASQKVEAVSKERQAALARTMALIHDARRKGIHQAPDPADSGATPAPSAPVESGAGSDDSSSSDDGQASSEAAAPAEP